TEKNNNTSETYSYGLTGTQLLFDGLKTSEDVKAASEDIKAAQYNYRYTSSLVRLRLRTAFINLLKAQELLGITEEIREIRMYNLELISLLYNSGIEHKGALLTAEANLAQADLEITQNKRALEVAQRELLKEMGRSQSSSLKAEGNFDISESAKEKPDFEILIGNNPSLGKLIAQRSAASYGIKSAQADFFPQLSAEAGANKNGSTWLPQDEQWNAGLSLTFPIFEGGLKIYEVNRAKALFNQAQANERSAKDSIILTLEQSWAALQDAVDGIGIQEKFLAAAQERAKIAQAQYSLGLIQFDNWTIIEDDLVRAKKAFLNARTSALLAEASWIQAKGETLEYEE
ncbi:MAG: TolC family protein, partial [Candidatus Omnitrophica bacterium]|nr:TolC family protein [Candidatus Omnitrophota bacterium]